ncbi:MAG: divalent-cation tolerance protein CutA [Elusimicrobia bacterium]|nr:divalent-cation tolerance protein CutA [Elusimicrobiota bacterium]
MPTPYDICFVTVSDEKTASIITDELIKEKLAACVSAVPGLSSTYRWQGKIEHTQEILLIIKTRKVLREDIIQAVRRKHAYSVPETVFLNIDEGNKEYLDWLGANTLFTSNISKDRPELNEI